MKRTMSKDLDILRQPIVWVQRLSQKLTQTIRTDNVYTNHCLKTHILSKIRQTGKEGGLL